MSFVRSLVAALVLVSVQQALGQTCEGGGQGLTPVAGECEPGLYDCAYCIDTSKKAKGSTWLESDTPPTTCAAYDNNRANPEGMKWIVVFGAIVGLVMAFGIGGNDAANSWSTAVGSGAVPLRTACIMGGVAEFLGATFLGAGVSGKIQKGVATIADEDCWACGMCNSQMGVYQLGMFAALLSTAIFLMSITFCSMPVSTTHAIVGGVTGMTASAVGWGCLNTSSSGLGGIAASWVISPVFSGIVASITYLATYFIVFKAKSPINAALSAVPVLYGLTAGAMLFLISKKSPVGKQLLGKDDDTLRIIICLIFAVIVPVVVNFTVMPNVKVEIERMQEEEEAPGKPQEEGQGSGKDAQLLAGVNTDEIQKPADNKIALEVEDVKDGLGMQIFQKSEPTREQRIAKKAFQNLLVFTALMESFAHGANDTANATGPFGAIWNTYRQGIYACDSDDTPWYILSAAGLAVFLGVYTVGYRVIQTVGSDLADMDFHLGFCVEFASGVTVICATYLGMPVSTTHCQVGAIIFVGVVSAGCGNVAWGMFGKIAMTWVLTLPLAGGLSALLLTIMRSF